MKSILVYNIISFFYNLNGVDGVKNAKIDFFLFDLEDDEVRTSHFNDARSYEWSPTACNFHSNMPCKFGTMEEKWSLLNGSNEKSLKDGGPDYPAIGFWSETYDSASLFSDPITCLEMDTRSIRVKLWVKGRWSFKICFLSADDGSVIGCGTSTSSTNFQIHRLELEQPFLDYIGDVRKNQEPMFIAMYAVVDNGVILLDDISFTGAPCQYKEEAPIDWIDLKTYSTEEDQVFNELLAPIVKRNFRRYLKTIMSQHGSNLDNANDYGHVCAKVPCPSLSGKCFYHGSLGTVEWQLEGMTYVAKFPPKKLGYAILTSTDLVDNPYKNDPSERWDLSGDFKLNFNYNHEAYSLRLIICFYSDVANSDQCQLVKKSPQNAANNWINVSILSRNRTFKFQIIAIQDSVRLKNETSEVIIRDINVLNCVDKTGIPKMMIALLLALKTASNLALEEQTYNFPIINNDELFMEPWVDNRSFSWLPGTCNFSEPCGYGTRESKWIRLSGSMDTVYPTLSAVHMPDLPSIAFGSNIMEKATLYSDPLRCFKPNTGVLFLRLWLHGSTSFRVCVVDASKASMKGCGSKISSFNSSFHSLDIREPIPVGSFGNDDLNILQLSFEVVNGFIIVDDISYSGEECSEETNSARRGDPKNIIKVYDVVKSQLENVKKEIGAVLSRELRLFGSYLIASFFHHKKTVETVNEGNVCATVPCNFDCDWSKYDFKQGISPFGKSMEFLQNTRGVWQQQVASISFRSSEIGYAVISSPRFAPLKDSKMTLFFKVGRAVQDKKLWFCEYYTTSQSCRILLKMSSDNSNDDWLKIKVELNKDIQQNDRCSDPMKFQIVISQTTRSNDPQLDQNMIRSINVLGC